MRSYSRLPIHASRFLALLISGLSFVAHAYAAPDEANNDTPQKGEIVRDQNGDLTANFKEMQFCNVKACRNVVTDRRTSAIVSVGPFLAKPYQRSGRGNEVVRARPFSNAERPPPVKLEPENASRRSAGSK